MSQAGGSLIFGGKLFHF